MQVEGRVQAGGVIDPPPHHVNHGLAAMQVGKGGVGGATATPLLPSAVNQCRWAEEEWELVVSGGAARRGWDFIPP